IFIGLIEGCAALGAITSSLYIQQKAEHFIGKSKVVIVSFFTLSFSFLMLSLSVNVWAWSVLVFFMGVVIVMNNVSVEASRSIAIPEEHRVKIQTIHNCIIGLGNPFGLLVIPYIVSKYSYSTALIFSCISVFLVAVFVKFIPMFDVLLDNDRDVSNLYKHTYGDK
ncbi:MFS transporter, partial [Xenorhabdus sp. PR6a]|uniref:MFS transporter n=1 Tax=Xenorhabdus sp. PR6a TaxID=3025877 RepID=UPI0023584C75